MNKELLNGLNDIKFVYRDKLNFDKRYKFGNEIEFEKASNYIVEQRLMKNIYLKKWDLHYEPTIQCEEDDISLGGEVVSPILHNNKKSWMDMKRACILLKELGAVAGSHCGAHIHIDQSILCDNNEYILNLIE